MISAIILNLTSQVHCVFIVVHKKKLKKNMVVNEKSIFVFAIFIT